MIRVIRLGCLILVCVACTACALGCGASRPASGGLVSEGQRVFVRAGCGSCHTVASAHTHGGIGPNFDTSESLDRRQIRSALNQGDGGMPSFRGRLTRREEAAVTEFVFHALHRRRP